MEKKTPAKKAAPKKTLVRKTTLVRKVEREAAPVIDLKGEGMIKALGRRKEAVAQVRVFPGTGKMVINGRAVADYFTVPELLHIVTSAQKAVGQDAAIDVSAHVKGGGIRGQAEAVRLGIARSLITMNEAFRPTLRKMGYVTRDARVKERKKYGLKSARRAPQFSKR